MNDDPKLSRVKWLHQKLTEQIDKEFDLLNQRMTWLIAGNAFLFSAFFIGLGIRQSTIGALDAVLTEPQKFQVVLHPFEKIFALSAIVMLGLFLCYASFVSMAAARQVIKEMKTIRQEYENELQIMMQFSFLITVPYRAGRHDLGDIMHAHLPKTIAIVWVLLALVAVSAVFGGVVGPTLSFLLLLIGTWFFNSKISKHIDEVVEEIESNHANSVEKYTVRIENNSA